MKLKIKMVRRRNELTKIDELKKVCCRPSDFLKVTGHRYAILISSENECETLDMQCAGQKLKGADKLSFAFETTPYALSKYGAETPQYAAYQAILYGYCVNSSYGPVAVFCGQDKDARKFTIYVPCFWE